MFLKKKKIFFAFIMPAFLFCFAQAELFPQDSASGTQKIEYTAKQKAMRITAEDVKLIEERNADGNISGYHLYVRKLDGVNSILLTETTRDPNGKADSYAYRATEYNPINGDEIRYLDGQKLVSEGAKYSLIDSTPEKTDFFDQAFHIFIPPVLQYGYEWSRNGVVEVGKGTFINIRTFEKPYADYSGDYMDSPFMFNLETRKKPKKNPPDPEPEPEPEPAVILSADYNPLASEKFSELSDFVVYSKGPETIVADIMEILEDEGAPLDVVFAIDATGSMKDDIETLKTDLLPALMGHFKDIESVRFGLLFYRDYGDSFNYKGLPVKVFGFTENLQAFNKNLNSIKIMGKEGGDIPEAVYEAIYSSVEFYGWRNGDNVNRQIILIGDAEPHPKPRGLGKYSKDFVMEKAETKKINVKAILLPSD